MSLLIRSVTSTKPFPEAPCGGRDAPSPDIDHFTLGGRLLDRSKYTNPESNYEQITLGMGCFWCSEDLFLQKKKANLNGIISTSVGYMGGEKDSPSYREIGSGRTGHAEVEKREYQKTRMILYYFGESDQQIHKFSFNFVGCCFL